MSDLVLLFVVATYFIAGLVKGTLGIGFPTAAIALTATVVDARTAIATVVIPMCLINAWQIYRSGGLKKVIVRNWRLAVTMVLAIGLFSVVSVSVPIRWLTFFLGFVTSTFALLSLWRELPALPDRYDHVAQLIAGTISGVFGGLAGIWAPPIIAYLSARRVDPNEFVRTVGVLLFIGSAMLLIGYLGNGMVHSGNALFSTSLLLPAIVGFTVGEQLRAKIASDSFQKIVLVMFFILGLNFIRRAIFG